MHHDAFPPLSRSGAVQVPPGPPVLCPHGRRRALLALSQLRDGSVRPQRPEQHGAHVRRPAHYLRQPPKGRAPRRRNHPQSLDRAMSVRRRGRDLDDPFQNLHPLSLALRAEQSVVHGPSGGLSPVCWRASAGTGDAPSARKPCWTRMSPRRISAIPSWCRSPSATWSSPISPPHPNALFPTSTSSAGVRLTIDTFSLHCHFVHYSFKLVQSASNCIDTSMQFLYTHFA